MSGRVLIAGFATRHVAQSAYRAGYSVCAVDHFCDQDLTWYTEDRLRFDDLDELPHAVEQMCGRHRFNMIVLTSGAEDMPSDVPVCGTPAEKTRSFLDKLITQHFFEDLGVPVPPLLPEGEYPAFVKPRRGAGGWRNAMVRSRAELLEWEKLYPGVPYIRQRIVEGVPASVCCVADGGSARAVASNEQILRNAKGAEFGFTGSVTPCSHPLAGEMIRQAERIAAASGCAGTVGIDFILTDEVTAIEVNPRFQATVDTVESATGCNLFRLHVDACRGTLPPTMQEPGRFAVRRILFADRDFTIEKDLKKLSPTVADIPWPGTSLEEGQAIVSVFGSGESRTAALNDLDKNITTVRQYLW